MTIENLAVLAAALGAGTAASAQCVPATLQGLGTHPGAIQSYATDISADGSTVVGFSSGPGGTGGQAFRWTAAAGLEDLGTLPGQSRAYAYGVNADGSIVVGTSDSPGGSYRAFRWTAATGMHGLGGALATTHSLARGISADGSVIVGDLQNQPFRWTAAGGLDVLGLWPQCHPGAASGVSADGTVMVGGPGYRWTTAGGFQCLELPFTASPNVAGVSGDGLVAVGGITFGGGINWPVRWTADGQMHGLGFPKTGGGARHATGSNADGSVIVGYSDGRGFIWTPAYGPLDLEDLLRFLGADLTNWTIEHGYRVSADGSTIIGAGQHLSAGTWRREAYVATVPLLLTSQPGPSLVCSGGTRSFRTSVVGTAAPFVFTWRRDGAPLGSGDPRVEVAVAPDGRSSTVTIHGVRGADAGTYDCIVSSGSCASLALFSTGVTVCPADYTCDGAVNSSDISAFLAAWLASVVAGDSAADFNGDAATNSSDISAFLASWLVAVTGGC